MNKYIICIILLMPAISGAPTAHAVDMRLSFKMLTDANRQPPQVGEFYTEAQINTHVDHINRIFAANNSEIRFVKDSSIVVLTSADAGEQAEIASHFNNDFSDQDYNNPYDNLDLAISDNPGLYQWRDDVINIYIFNTPVGGAGARYPPWENPNLFAMFTQAAINNNTFAHEVGGHWLGYFGDIDTDPTNLMDNTSETGEVIYPNLLEALSKNGYKDKWRVYIRKPIYVSLDRGSINGDGSWDNKYQTLSQQALDKCESTNGVIVMESGTYVVAQPISNQNIIIEPRLGSVILEGAP